MNYPFFGADLNVVQPLSLTSPNDWATFQFRILKFVVVVLSLSLGVGREEQKNHFQIKALSFLL